MANLPPATSTPATGINTTNGTGGNNFAADVVYTSGAP
jgi:hypothetical protein